MIHAADIVSLAQLRIMLGPEAIDVRAELARETAMSIAQALVKPEIFDVQTGRHVRGAVRAAIILMTKDIYESDGNEISISEEAEMLLKPFHRTPATG